MENTEKPERPYIEFENDLLCLFSVDSKGEDKNVKLASCNIILVAKSEDGEKILLRYGTNLSNQTNFGVKQRIISIGSLAGKSDLTKIISPYSYFATPQQHEEVKAYLTDKPCPITLVDLTGVFGRVKRPEVDFWIVKDWIIFKDPDRQPIPIPAHQILDLEIDNFIYHIDTNKINHTLIPEVKLSPQQSIDDIIESWLSVYQCRPLLFAILGYFAACMYTPEVVATCKNLPLFQIVGTTSMGKTALLQALYNFWGLTFQPQNYTLVSPHVEIKQLCQASCFPIWRDEFRKTGYSYAKEGLLRSIHDRSPLDKGTSSQDLLFYEARGTLLLSGEDVIQDPALRRRIIMFQLHESYKLKPIEWVKAVKNAEKNFPQLFPAFLSAKWNQKVFEEILKLPLVTDNAPEKEIVLYAALAAITSPEWGKMAVEEANKYWEEVKKNGDKLTTRMSAVEDFFEFMQNFLTTKGMFEGRTIGQNRVQAEIRRYIKIDNGEVKMYLWGLIQLAYKNGFKEHTNLGESAIKTMIFDYFNVKSVDIRIDNWKGKGIKFEQEQIKMESLNFIIENTEEAEKKDNQEESNIALSSKSWR